MMRKYFSTLIRLLALPILLALPDLAGAEGPPAAQPQKPENVIEVRAIRMRPTVTLGGTVVPLKDVTLAAELPGRVNFIAGKEGDAFDKGTLLVALNDEELQARRRAALAALRSADAELRNAGITFSREIWNPQGAPTTKAPGGMGLPSLFDQMFTTPAQNVMGFQYPGSIGTPTCMVMVPALNRRAAHSCRQSRRSNSLMQKLGTASQLRHFPE